MFSPALAQPKIIDDLKQIIEEIGLNPEIPDDVHVSIERALHLIAHHKGAPKRFRDAMDAAMEQLKATPLEAFEALGALNATPYEEDPVEIRERMYFARTMGQIENVDPDKADAFISANPEPWKTWQQASEFWRTELS